MSLNREELQRTRDELQANLELSGLTVAELQSDLGFPAARLRAALTLGGNDPADTWLLRDYLHRAVLDAGRTPQPFTVLTERSRRKVRTWFRLQEAPRHDFTS